MVKEMRILLALGGNLPFGASPPARTIADAIGALGEEGLEVQRISRLYSTAAFPAGSGPDYTNAAAVVTLRHTSELTDPEHVLQALHRVETRFGRQRLGRWQGRTLDIDLIAMEDSVRPDRQTQTDWRAMALADQTRSTPSGLILPHPRLQDRAFVLVPLADVAPDWRHPLLNLSVSQMLDALPKADIAAVTPL